jgi:hypothetical protein
MLRVKDCTHFGSKTPIFLQFFGENIFKIVTLVPGAACRRFDNGLFPRLKIPRQRSSRVKIWKQKKIQEKKFLPCFEKDEKYAKKPRRISYLFLDSYLQSFHLKCSTFCLSFFLSFGGVNFAAERGCQMAYFQTKNPNLGKFWRGLLWKMLVYFMAFWSNFRRFGIHMTHYIFCIFCGHLVYFLRFGTLYREKSGNPAGVVERNPHFLSQMLFRGREKCCLRSSAKEAGLYCYYLFALALFLNFKRG